MSQSSQIVPPITYSASLISQAAVALTMPLPLPPPPPPVTSDNYAWVGTAASSALETALAVATDPARGTVYMVGKWSGGLQGAYGDGTGGTVDFTNTAGGEDAFVAKYDTVGNLLWAFAIGGSGDDVAYGVAVSPNSDTIYVCGAVGGSATADYTGMPGSMTQTFNVPNNGTAGFIAAYDTNGFLLWSTTIRASANNRSMVIRDIASATHGLYTTGFWEGPAQFGGGVGNLNAMGTEDVFLLRSNPTTGSPTWARRGQGSSDCRGYGVAVDASSAYIVGDMEGDIDLDGSPGPVANIAPGTDDIFLAAYDSSGAYLWAEFIQSNQDDHARGVVAGSSSVFVTGNVNVGATFPGIGVPTGGNGADFFISEHDKANGNTIWQERAVGTDDDMGHDLSVTSSGDVFAVIDLHGNTDFSGNLLATSGGTDIVTARYQGGSGVLLSLEHVTGPGNDHGYGIACIGDSMAFMAGAMGASADFLPLPTTVPGFSNDNIVLARIGLGALPPGWNWASSYNGANFNCVSSVALDSANQWVYVAGTIEDSSTFDMFIPNAEMNFGNGEGRRDGFLAKFHYDGTPIWALNISSGLDDEVTGVTLGTDGNVYVTGFANGNTEFKGTGSSAALVRNSVVNTFGKMFVAAYNPAGEVIWANLEGGTLGDRGLAICASDSGIFVSGIYTVDRPTGMIAGQPYLHPQNNVINAFVARYAYSGAGEWLAEIGTIENDTVSTNVQEIGMGITCFGDSLYVIGAQAGANTTIVDGTGATFTNITTNPFGANEAIFVSSFTVSGAFRWNQGIFDAASGTIRGFGIDADCDGIYITGSIHDNSPFPSGTLTSSNHDAAFLAQLSHSTGVDQWLQNLDGTIMGGNHRRVGYALDADQLGNIFFAGQYVGNGFNSGGFVLPNASAADIFIFEYENTGVPIHGIAAGGPGQDVAYGLAVDPAQGFMFAGGIHGATASFSPFSLSGNGAENIWIGRNDVAAGGLNVPCCPRPLLADAGPDRSICIGDSINLSATGGLNYTWSPALGLSCTNCPNPIAFPTSTTTYFLTADDGGACTGFDSIVVTVLPYPTATASVSGPVCQGDSAQLSATGGVSYSWSPTTGLSDPNIPNPMASPAVTTQYTVIVGNAGNCFDTAMVQVVVNPLPIADAGRDTVICLGEIAQLQASGGGTYSWFTTTGLNNPSIPNPTATLLNSVTYYVTVTGGAGCSAVDSVTVTLRPPPPITFNPAGPYCVTDPQDTLWARPAGGTWGGTGIVGTGPGIFDPGVAGIGTHQISYIGTDSFGCTATDTLSVSVIAPPSAAWSLNPDTLCLGGPGILLSSLVTGTPGGTFTSSTGVIFGDSLAPMASGAGNHVLTYTVANAACRDSLDQVLTVLRDYSAAWTISDTICAAAGPLQLAGRLDPGADPGGTWQGVGVTGSVFDPGGLSGNVQITYTVGLAPCEATVSNTIVVVPDLDATWDNMAVDSLCPDSQMIDLATLVTGTPGGTWAGAGVSGNMFSPAGLSGAIPVTYTVGNGQCSESLSLDFFVRIVVEPDAGQDTSICGDTYLLQALTFGQTGNWVPQANVVLGDSSDPSSPLIAQQYGTYVLRWMTEQDGCSAMDEVEITFVEPLSAAEAGQDQTIYLGEVLELNAQAPGRGTGTWQVLSGSGAFVASNDPQTEVFEYLEGTHIYQWTVTDGPCQSQDAVEIQVLGLVVPTGFSPNEDGTNDTWVIRGVHTIRNNEVVVLNRWGNEVYRRKNYQNDWSGQNFEGQPLPDDTYYFILTGEDFETVKSYLVIKR